VRRSTRWTVALLLAAFAAVLGLLLVLGVLVTHFTASGPLHRFELRIEADLVASRRPWLDAVTRAGTVIGSTVTVIVLTAIGCLVLAWRGHGIRLPLFLVAAVLGETLLFLIAQQGFHRPRPPVLRLDPAAPTASFPSGHTAATVALWGGLALGMARTHPGHTLLALARVLAVALPVFVLFTRLYRGMHWPTDVAASLVFTWTWLVLLREVLLPHGKRVFGGSAGRLSP
jgi:undecaprenyl-diphosphatase